MAINFFFEDVKKIALKKRNDKKWIVHCIEERKKNVGDINFIFCSDSYLIELNRKHLQHDYYTDIITFDYCEGDILSGDIYISVDRVLENSEDLELLFDTELHRVMIHGILHLLGLKDATEIEKRQMRSSEDKCLDYYS